jgi:branched-chain amino acid transport system permease protein
MLRVLREDPVMVAALGRDPKRLSALVTAVAWTLAAAGGALHAHVLGYVAPSSYGVVETFVVWTGLVLGGSGRIVGVVAGTCLVQLLSMSTRFLADWTGIAFDVVANLRLGLVGLALVLVLLLRPHGVLPERLQRTPLPKEQP